MRLFIAIDIDDSIREGLARFIDGVRNFAPDARWVKPESLHVTLKFIGEQPDAAVEGIKQALAAISVPRAEIHFHGYGFFPTPKSARVFWIGMEAGPQLAALAAAIDDKMGILGIPKEERSFSPHLTLARAGGGSGSPQRRKGDKPNRVFQHLQNRLAVLPTVEFGNMTPFEFFLYQSQLSPKGSKYIKLARFVLQSHVT
ncbi:MAG TPA: RNA 2',3'-cyclic phosphodiesterase [Candidatus Sulfotelmatobacter sp.]|nr:RNA 2',3'-cyclic phosphodiesterase [Candidatus Sulfotelmatobacter sp.]